MIFVLHDRQLIAPQYLKHLLTKIIILKIVLSLELYEREKETLVHFARKEEENVSKIRF